MQIAREGTLTVFVKGRIRNRDIFGDEWRLEIDRYWHSGSSYRATSAFAGKWVLVGSGSRDTHRQAEQSCNAPPRMHV
jgi:hypothetical protein